MRRNLVLIVGLQGFLSRGIDRFENVFSLSGVDEVLEQRIVAVRRGSQLN